jgi:formylmethanofuran dehydrogenase subunit A
VTDIAKWIRDPSQLTAAEEAERARVTREVDAASTVFETELTAAAAGPFTPYPRVHLRVMSDELRLKERVG